MPVLIEMIKRLNTILFPVVRLYWFLFRPASTGVKCVISTGDTILMIRNTYGRKRWTFPGGSLKKRELPTEAIQREIWEEVGIRLTNLRLLGQFLSTQEYKKDTVVCFRADAVGASLSTDPHEILEARWFHPQNLPENRPHRSKNSHAMVNQMIIRPATTADFDSLYELGKDTPELQVSATEEFMAPDEFRWALTDPNAVFLVAQEGDGLHGFVYATADDKEKPLPNKWACLVYLAVAPEFRRRGIATSLYAECVQKLKDMGMTDLYGWAHAQGSGGITQFMQGHGFQEGHLYRWMNKKI